MTCEPATRKWGLILGASSGMGEGCARALAAHGMNVLGVHLDIAEHQPRVDHLVTELQSMGSEVHYFNANAASESNQKAIIQGIAPLVGSDGIHLLVHSLAFGTLLPFIPSATDHEVISRRQMDMTLTVMAHTLVYWVQELFAQRLLQAGAKVMALTSAGSTKVTRAYGAVSAAKSALESHVRQLALELAPHNIAVNAIRAGVTDTPALRRIPGSEKLKARALSDNPHGRLTTPQDVGTAVVLLSAATSSWITGNAIGVDGGELCAS